MADNFQGDLAAVARIDAVPTILEVVCRTTGMGFAAVARVTDKRWIACAVRDEISFGLKPGGELKLETTICNEIRASGEGVVIDHVAEDEAFCGHPTPAMYGFQSYISMPIVRPGGAFFGTLCAIDPRPASLKRPEVAQMFRLFADLIAFYLEADERMAATEAALLDERQAAELREQFIAVLGHDLRNPLASIDAGVRMLQKEALGGRGPAIVRLVQSSVSRMAELIDNVLDFARGRLGGGLKLDLNAEARLRPVLEQVVAELRSAWPERAIETALVIDQPVNCDRARIAQLLSNLLGNALTHGAPDAPARVSASSDGDVFVLSVENKGEPIPPGTVDRLFQPFFRGAGRTGQQGLGLGLYIASEIARAHGGTLTVASSPERTRFTLRMPRGDAPREAGASARGKEELQSGVALCRAGPG
ncbi:MAG TPA: GAF domain-containing sensor histidine kinase [Beijerinckiaceae bacterium]|nr:GAF domain-containing sensor histidine kinase [Beijerinckiaceae bacterium]